jgi:hypothetical protein
VDVVAGVARLGVHVIPKRKFDPRAVAAIDAMWAEPMPPPPPLRIEPRSRTAGELALAREKRAGLLADQYLYIRMGGGGGARE